MKATCAPSLPLPIKLSLHAALQYLCYADFVPLLECVLLYHPGLEFLQVRGWRGTVGRKGSARGSMGAVRG